MTVGDSGCFPIQVKQLDLFLCVRFGRPLAGRLREDLNGIAIDRLTRSRDLSTPPAMDIWAPATGRAVFSLVFIRLRTA